MELQAKQVDYSKVLSSYDLHLLSWDWYSTYQPKSPKKNGSKNLHDLQPNWLPIYHSYLLHRDLELLPKQSTTCLEASYSKHILALSDDRVCNSMKMQKKIWNNYDDYQVPKRKINSNTKSKQPKTSPHSKQPHHDDTTTKRSKISKLYTTVHDDKTISSNIIDRSQIVLLGL